MRTPNPIDIHVGARLRQRRLECGVSQKELGEALELSFQQIQKYERGATRIGASRLWKIAKRLDAPVAYFFEGLTEDTNANSVIAPITDLERVPEKWIPVFGENARQNKTLEQGLRL